MLKNYLTIALRHLWRHRGYAFINVAGLAVGIACCLLILLFVRDELSYDRFHTNADRIYRVVSDWGNFSVPATNPPTVVRLAADYPEITVAPLMPEEALVQYEDRRFQEEGLYFASPAVFDVFDFPLVRGDPRTALAEPFTAILTETTARRYFGDEDPVGRTIRLENQFEATVTGVARDVPENAHFRFDFLLSWATLDAVFDFSNSTAWGNNGIYTYLLLPEDYAPETLEAQFPAFIERHAGPNWNGAELSLQALTDIHLHSRHNMELAPNGDVRYVYVFSVIALFILLVACVNFMNLATARSAERAKEVGVRKVVGAQRSQLVRQFLAESVLLSLCALVLAVGLTLLALPGFRALSGKAMPAGVLGDGFTLLAFLGVTLFVGVLAGSYPALFLSAFRPVHVLKGGLRRGTRGARLRKGLVVFQFATSICLIVGTAVVYAQLGHLRGASLGFAEEQVLVVPAQNESVRDRFAAFRSALQGRPEVLDVTIASESLPSELLNGSLLRLDGAAEDESVSLRTVSVGHGFFETLGVEMAAGRGFSAEHPSDSAAFVVNEAAFRLIAETAPGLAAPSDAVGRTAHLDTGGRTGPLLGVVKDFNLSSLHEAIEPMVFFMHPGWYDHFLLRVRPEAAPAAVAALEDAWARLFPEWPLAFRFADQAFDAQYRAEERLSLVFAVFAGLALFVACLGLFGLAAYTAEQRTKEIGVRKVLGASVPGLVGLLSKDFLRLVALAFAIAAPVAYLAMDRWLSDFAYRVEIGAGVFVAAGAAVLVVALATVSYQAIRAAMADPVQSLRYE